MKSLELETTIENCKCGNERESNIDIGKIQDFYKKDIELYESLLHYFLKQMVEQGEEIIPIYHYKREMGIDFVRITLDIDNVIGTIILEEAKEMLKKHKLKVNNEEYFSGVLFRKIMGLD